MLNNEQVGALLKEINVLIEGHFLLTSGRHSNKYLQCAKIFKSPKYSEIFCKELADKFRGSKVDIVIGPAMGAIQMAYEVSRQLGVINCFAERDEQGKMQLRRGFKISEGNRVLVVEDVVTTGGSVKEVIALVRELGGEVVGVGSIVNRAEGKNPFDVPFQSAYIADVETFDAENCPLCREGKIPPVKPGSRKTI